MNSYNSCDPFNVYRLTYCVRIDSIYTTSYIVCEFMQLVCFRTSGRASYKLYEFMQFERLSHKLDEFEQTVDTLEYQFEL